MATVQSFLALHFSFFYFLFFAQLYIVAFPDLGLNPPNPEELNRLLIDHVMKQSGPMMIRSDHVEMTMGIILQFSLVFVWMWIKTMIIIIMMILIKVQMK